MSKLRHFLAFLTFYGIFWHFLAFFDINLNLENCGENWTIVQEHKTSMDVHGHAKKCPNLSKVVQGRQSRLLFCLLHMNCNRWMIKTCKNFLLHVLSQLELLKLWNWYFLFNNNFFQACIVINKNGQIFRFSTNKSLFLFSLFNRIRRLAIFIVTHQYPF